MSLTVLVTGFGPFPGTPFNPTGALVQRLIRTRRPSLADVKIVSHVFATSYTAVDRELPMLIAKHQPDVLLMFGLAPRARGIRVETRARNTVTFLPDAAGTCARRNAIAPGKPQSVCLPTPARSLVAALRHTTWPVALSRDAGRYLCNYLCWRATELASGDIGPGLAAFIHVPPARRGARRRGVKNLPGLNDLAAAGGRILAALVAAARHHRPAVRRAGNAAGCRAVPESVPPGLVSARL
jgi:pyroglutamyl-peptidase